MLVGAGHFIVAEAVQPRLPAGRSAELSCTKIGYHARGESYMYGEDGQDFTKQKVKFHVGKILPALALSS